MREKTYIYAYVNQMCLREKLFGTEKSIDILQANLNIGLIRNVKKIQYQRISVGEGQVEESERSTYGVVGSSASFYHINDPLENSPANKATASFSRTAY